jgi:Uma2 family endonuclease
MEVMTMTQPLVYPGALDPWTVEDLDRLPVDNGQRYELVDGTLLMSPMPAIPHVRVTNRLHRLLDRQAPQDVEVGQNGGITIDGPRTYFVPDIFVVQARAYDSDEKELDPADVLMVVEVLSPSNSGIDLVIKRHYYARAGIERYWIVDQQARTLTVLRLDGAAYREDAVVRPGATWQTDQPFPLGLDLAEVL